MPKVIAHEEIAQRYVETTEMPSKYVSSSAQQKSGQSQSEEEGRGSSLRSAKRGKEVCPFLIEAEADVGQVDNSGMSPVHAAAAPGLGAVSEILLNINTSQHPDKEERGGTCGTTCEKVVAVGRSFQVGPRWLVCLKYFSFVILLKSVSGFL